tara:strand:- start:13555 stop:13725 length:171 start_codon:yes stop_codon:yes gene_type:complete
MKITRRQIREIIRETIDLDEDASLDDIISRVMSSIESDDEVPQKRKSRIQGTRKKG